MKKALIALSVLLVVIAIVFVGLSSKEKHETKTNKITRKIPSTASPKPSKHAKKRATITPSASDKISAKKQVYLIQIGAFNTFRVVLHKLLNLKSRGYHAFYSCEAKKNNETLYRIFTECLLSKKAADAKAGELKKRGLISDYVIKPVNIKNPTELSDCAFGSKIYLLHVSSLKQKRNAEKTVQMLKVYSDRSIYVVQKVSGESWFRVYLGEFNDENQALKLGKKLQSKGMIAYYKPIPHDQIIGRPLRDVATAIKKVDRSPLPTLKKPKRSIQPQKPKKKSKATAKNSENPLIIDDITFQIKKGVKEIVLVHANRTFAPSLGFAPEKSKPKVVIAIKKPAIFKPDKTIITTKGEWIRSVQIQPDANKDTLMIVLNLKADQDYNVSQTFYEPQSAYAVKVIAK